MKILVCGSRYYNDYEKIYKVLKNLKKEHKEIIVIEGGAKGADSLAKKAATDLNLPVKEYPAEWKKYGRAAGPKRNQKMLDENSDIKLVIAFHEDIENSKGTKDMIKRARKKNLEIIIED